MLHSPFQSVWGLITHALRPFSTNTARFTEKQTETRRGFCWVGVDVLEFKGKY